MAMADRFSKANSNAILSKAVQNSKKADTEIINIETNLIDENPDNAKIFNMENIGALAENIRREGFTGAIEVIETGSGRYEIISGHRRFRAMQILGRDVIPCIITKCADARAKAERLLSSNVFSREMKLIDWGRAIRYYCENVSPEGVVNSTSRKEAMEYFNFTPSKLSRCLSLLDLTPELAAFCEEDGFPSASLAKAVALDRDIQVKLANDIAAVKEEVRARGIDELEGQSYMSKALLETMIDSYRPRRAEEKRPISVMPEAVYQPEYDDTGDSGESLEKTEEKDAGVKKARVVIMDTPEEVAASQETVPEAEAKELKQSAADTSVFADRYIDTIKKNVSLISELAELSPENRKKLVEIMDEIRKLL